MEHGKRTRSNQHSLSGDWLPAEPLRRSFFKRTGALAGGVVTGATLSTLSAHMALADDDRRHQDGHRRGRRSDYGELSPTPDQNGDKFLALPKDFEYVTFSKTGDTFGNGLLVPSRHDGMAAFDGPGHRIRIRLRTASPASIA